MSHQFAACTHHHPIHAASLPRILSYITLTCRSPEIREILQSVTNWLVWSHEAPTRLLKLIVVGWLSATH